MKKLLFIIFMLSTLSLEAATHRPDTLIKIDNVHTHINTDESIFNVIAFVDDLDSVQKLGKFELGIEPPQDVLDAIEAFIENSNNPKLNPFLSNEIRITASFTHEYSKKYYPRDAFYTKDFDRDVSGFEDLYDHDVKYWDPTDERNEEPYKELGGNWTPLETAYPFRVRFAPEFTGKWECIINITSSLGNWQLPVFTFNVVDSNNKGFLKADNNGRFLKRDGESFRPIGVNYSWPTYYNYNVYNQYVSPLMIRDEEGNKLINETQYYYVTAPIAAYEQYLRYIDTLAMNDINYFRLLMNPWSLDIEFEEMGNYSDRMHIAKEMDLIIDRAVQNDIMIHWNLMAQFSFNHAPYGILWWDWLPRNAVFGWTEKDKGNCYNHELNLPDVVSFFRNEDAKKYYKERLRYIVSRWGYSPQIGMFEHFSEINQFENDQVIEAWHREMSNYLKNELKTPQLITVSYLAGIDVSKDRSFEDENIDVINANNYNYSSSDVHNYHRHKIRRQIAERGEDYDNGENLWGNFNKPLFFSEMGAHEVWKCDNGIETKRSIWQSYFWGIAGGLDWEFPADLSIYKRVNEFISGVDLEAEKWHSGMVKLDKEDKWEYKKAYRNDCIRKDELADAVYLRSGNKEKAYGVITNRRANYYTLGKEECTDNSGDITAPLHSDPSKEEFTKLLQSYGSVSPGNFDNRLRLRNMKFAKKYKIKYYSPFDQVNSIKEETRWGSQLTLEFPDMDTLDIILFEVFPVGERFKNRKQ